MSYRNYEEDQLADERAPIEAAREAVIEAAKAWCDEHILGDKASINRRALELASAVEALQEAGA